MRIDTNSFDNPRRDHLTVACFWNEKAGASMYEFALLASLVAVVSIIILIALSLGK